MTVLTGEVELEDAAWQGLLYPGRLEVGEGGSAVGVATSLVVGLKY